MKKYFRNLSIIIFILIAIFYVVSNFVWWKNNTPILPSNISALHFNDIFKEYFLYYNAPLITWIMKLMFAIFGKTYFDLQIIFVNLIFFLIALVCIYKIGLELKDKETGNIAMILFALTPIIYISSRHYGHQDWHIMPPMVFNIYCLIKSNNFNNRKWSIFYGISVGIGLLIKDEFLAYFFTPWLYVAIKSLVEKIEIKKISNILITILIGSFMCGCHYFRYWIINKIWHEPVIETAPIFCFKSLSFTTTGLSEYLLSPVLFIPFIIALIWFIIKFKNKNKWIILLWFIVPWLIITFMPHHKEAVYQISYVPAMILMVSILLTNINIKYIKKFLVYFIILICVIQYIFFSYKLKSCTLSELLNKYYVYYDTVLYINDVKYEKNLFETILKIKKQYYVILDFVSSLNCDVLVLLKNIFFEKENINIKVCRELDDYNIDDVNILFISDENENKNILELAEEEYDVFEKFPGIKENYKIEFINSRVKLFNRMKENIKSKFVLYKIIKYNDEYIKIFVKK